MTETFVRIPERQQQQGEDEPLEQETLIPNENRNNKNIRNDIMSALDLLSITQSAREKLNLHHEEEILKGLIPTEKCCEPENKMHTRLPNKVVTPFRPPRSPAKNTRHNFAGKTLQPSFTKLQSSKNPKISHYQALSNALANWIFMNSKEKIIAATIKGHGWTNIYQYLPTNHPDGISQIMPILSAAKSQLWASIPKKEQEDLLKYFAGIDAHGMPIKSTKENDGVPLILLIQGPKIGATRSLDCLRAQGLNTVMDQLKAKFNELYPGVSIVHRWVGKNGYIMEAVWDHEGYQNRLDMRSLLKNA